MTIIQADVIADLDGLPVQAKGVFDLSALETITRCNPVQRQALIRLVAELVAKSAAELSQAHALCTAGEERPALKMLHTLRGSVGNLGARRFADATILIEHAIQKNAPGIAGFFEAAGVELADTLSIAEIWLKHAAKVE